MTIGITGTLGAGKGAVVEYLKTKGFKHFSVRDFLLEEISRRGLPQNRDSMTHVANDLRAEHGPEYISKQLFARAKTEPIHAVIESIRSLGEASYLKEEGAVLIAVDADLKTRYERAVARGSETDKVTYEKFVEDEQREFANEDPSKQNIQGVMKMADYVIQNDGTLEELHAQVDAILEKIK